MQEEDNFQCGWTTSRDGLEDYCMNSLKRTVLETHDSQHSMQKGYLIMIDAVIYLSYLL